MQIPLKEVNSGDSSPPKVTMSSKIPNVTTVSVERELGEAMSKTMEEEQRTKHLSSMMRMEILTRGLESVLFNHSTIVGSS